MGTWVKDTYVGKSRTHLVRTIKADHGQLHFPMYKHRFFGWRRYKEGKGWAAFSSLPKARQYIIDNLTHGTH